MLPVKIDRNRYRKFGYKLKNGKIHIGHDFDCPVNTEIFAIADGKVLFSERANGFGSMYPHTSGGVIIIEHTNNNGEKFTALYGHVRRLVNIDAEVKEGDKIGEVSAFYYKEDFLPHLHFAIHIGSGMPPKSWGYVKDIGDWTNPLIYMETFVN